MCLITGEKKILAGAKDIHQEQARRERLALEHPGALRWLCLGLDTPRSVLWMLRLGGTGMLPGSPGHGALIGPGRAWLGQSPQPAQSRG